MAKRNLPLPSVAYLHERLECNFETGELAWKPKPSPDLSAHWHAHRAVKLWNTRYAGKPAFTAIKDTKGSKKYGYKVGAIDDVAYRAHHVIYAMYHGEWPDDLLDHFDGDPANNAISNLRPGSQSTNMRNARMKQGNRGNRSGVTGVYHQPANTRSPWVAQVYFENGARKTKSFATLEEAAEWRALMMSRAGGYTQRHGMPSLDDQ